MKRQRLDVLLVSQELAPDLARARALILAGRVFWNDQRLDKAGHQVPAAAELSVRGRDHPYVSRGGVKLAGALDAFGVDPSGDVAADFGASTGGFTDCLLRRGAARVYAIDVGYGQLAHRLRVHDRVVVMERTNARQVVQLPEPIDLVVIDASFISITRLLPAARAVLREGGEVIGMVKPQFEVSRDALERGIVRDEGRRAAAIDAVADAACSLGFQLLGRADSVLAGPGGNIEAFLRLVRPATRRRWSCSSGRTS